KTSATSTSTTTARSSCSRRQATSASPAPACRATSRPIGPGAVGERFPLVTEPSTRSRDEDQHRSEQLDPESDSHGPSAQHSSLWALRTPGMGQAKENECEASHRADDYES